MIAEASNNGHGQGGSPMDLASPIDQADHGTSSGPAAESRPFPWGAAVACLALAWVAGWYLGRAIVEESMP